MHHEIVALEKQHQPLPEDGFTFPASTTYTLNSYTTARSREELHARIRNATIAIVTISPIDAQTLHPDVTPHLKLIVVGATGTNAVDLEAAKKRGIRVANCPSANVDAVSEHAISLYFAARRRTALLDQKTREHPSEWKATGSLNKYMRLPDGKMPLTCSDEVLGVIGYGGIGKRIAELGNALGMKVLVAARKAPSTTASSLGGVLPAPNADDNRVPFDDVLGRATALVLALPRNAQTQNLISTPEFEKMYPYAVVINIARGGIVDEGAVVQALKDKRIAGYATDVYEVEPAGGPEDTPLLGEDAKGLNITLSPHLAWMSQRTMKNLADIMRNTVEGWVSGDAINVVV